MDEIQKENDDEISIKSLILIVLKEIKLIIAITAVVIGLALVYLLFIKTDVYQASLTLMTNPIETRSVSELRNTDISSIVETTNNPFMAMDVQIYQAQLLNSDVLMGTIEELNLTNKDGTPMLQASLQRMLAVEVVERTNLIRLTVENTDPELAARIANTVGNQFIQFITDKIHNYTDMVSQNVDESLARERIRLDEEAARWRDYLLQLDSIDITKNEISTLISQITDYKASLNTTTRDIAIYRNSLEVLLNGGKTVTALDLNALDLSISGSNQGSYSVRINNQNQLQNSLVTIQAVNWETTLVQALERKKVLEAEIVVLENRLSELQAKLAQEQYLYDSVLRDYNLAQLAYTAYQTKSKEIKMALVADIGRISVLVSMQAVPPEEPTGTSKILILFVAAVAGGMLAVFIAFFKAYWNSEISLETPPVKEAAVKNDEEGIDSLGNREP